MARLFLLCQVVMGLALTADACSGFYVGKKVSKDGSILLGRTIDVGPAAGSRVVVVPRVENVPGRVYRRTFADSEFSWPLPPTTYKYVMTPMGTGYLCGECAACCINEKGLGITGTVAGSTRRQLPIAFPYEKNGVADYNFPGLVAAMCATAREAVELTAKTMEKLGTLEPSVFMVADQKEAWLIETYVGHLWAAHKLPDDVAGGYGNHFVLGEYDPASDEWAATPDIARLLEEKGLAVYVNGKLHLEKSIGGDRYQFTNLRSWFSKRLIAPGTEGEYHTKSYFECFYPPSRKLGPEDVAMLTRSRYTGTEWDPDVNDRNDVRVIGTETMMSSHVIQVRPDLPPGRALTAWVALSPAEHTPYLPVANCATEVDERFSRDHVDPAECYSRYYPELYAADAFRFLCGMCEQDRVRYGNAVRDYWLKREQELFAKWPSVWESGDVRAMDEFTLREQRRALADAKRMASEIAQAMTRNGRKLVQMQRDGIYRRWRPDWIYEPSDVAAARTAQHACDPEVIVPSGACAAVTAAANEFRKYWHEVTDRPVAKASEKRVTFEVDPKLDAAHDEYRIVSDDKGVRFVGANGRAVLYAVYDFFERQAGCRWFWDGDKVPKKETIELGGLDVREKARFEYRGLRYFAHRGLTRFQAEHWGLEAWKKEIDWMLKRRLNIFMPRIGMDDVWQKAFPDIVPYPDPTKKLPEATKGYDNRSLFWSLQDRGELRRQFTAYARDRGLMVPTDSGTLTHWYSRTPIAFLEKENPPFIKQACKLYGERTGLVFDVTQEKWMDKYWRLSEAAMESGYGDSNLLHTVALGERMISTNRAENLAYKVAHLKRMFGYLGRKRPDAQMLFAGWDLYNTWLPSEVRSLIPQLDPKRVMIWDYEADSTEGTQPGAKPDDQRNFTRWDLVGKFPYTFGIFLAYENALDIRANYRLIEEREKVAAADPMCKGYIFWPESSHTDTFLLRYFTANAWKPGQSHEQLLPAFCRDRYGRNAAKFEDAWKRVIPLSSILGWWGNWGMNTTWWSDEYLEGRDYEQDRELLEAGPEALGILASIEPEDEFQRRDVIDLARTVIDRATIAARYHLARDYAGWCSNTVSAAEVKRSAKAYLKLVNAATEILALHTDYSLDESYDRLCRDGDVRAKDFPKVLLDNAINGYCRSHQYEIAAGWYQPMAKAVVAEFLRRLEAGDRTEVPKAFFEQTHKSTYDAMVEQGFGPLRPTLPRLRREYLRVLGNAREAAAR